MPWNILCRLRTIVVSKGVFEHQRTLAKRGSETPTSYLVRAGQDFSVLTRV